MNNFVSRLRLGFLCFAVLLVAACGGGGSDSPPPPPPPPTVPSGTWFGTMEDAGGIMHTLSVTTSGNSITQILVDGTSTGQTGTMTHQSGGVFGFTLSDTTRGGFFLNTAQTHAAFLDDDDNIGVVQRGATSLPPFVYSDINGSWSGIVFTVPANFSTFSVATSTATCNVPSTCVGTGSGVTTTATFTQNNFNSFSGPSRGRWVGTFSATDGTSGEIEAFLSADRRFAATWACIPPVTVSTFPANCDFTAWSKL